MANIEDVYPLSPMQQGMLFHSLYAPDSGVYVEQVSSTLHGDLNIQAFERAWQHVVNRHAILRTAFVWEGLDEPLQVVHQQVQLPLEQFDWRTLSHAEQEAKLEAFLQTEQRRGFELSQAPLMRLAIMQLADDTYQFVWSHHHLLLDGWCLPLLLREVLAFYQAYHQGQPVQLERSRPYRDYIAWLQQQDMSRAEAFWRKTLEGFTAPTPLPGQRVPGSSGPQPDGYHTAHLKLSGESTAALQSLARQQQLTLNTLVQGAWALLLHRYSGEAEVVFGATVSGRPPDLAGAEMMLGLFINTLPVRVAVMPHMPLLSWLKALQVQQAELREYEYSSLLQIQGWSDVPRGMPLFESILIFENYPVDTSLRRDEGGLRIRNVRSFAQTNYPLTVVAAPSRELSLRILYEGHRFDRDAILQMLRHLQTMLEGFVADPEQPLATLPLLTEPERQRLFVEWNDTRTDYPHNRCVPEWFETVVEQQPGAIAVIFDDAQLTYRQLNARANQLAHHLKRLGVSPESLVGICMERSIEMVVALLGILKAGGAFLPLDPSYPTERLAYMVEDSGVSMVLTQQPLVERLPASQTQVVCLDTVWEAIARESIVNPVSGTVPENLAYVIYTSGSTGQPKGTMLHHRGLCNLATAQQKAFGVQEGDRILQFSSLSFDAAVWEVVMAFLSGAALGLASRAQLSVGQGLLDVLRTQRITAVTLPPSVLAVLPEEPLPDLQTIITAGEACSQALVNRWAGGRRYFNAYGPTETTVCASLDLCTESSPQGPPIGRPLANTQLYILDANLQPVPVGVPGELYIGGVGVGRGYLQRAALTAEQFRPHPFSSAPGARLYKSGDLGRYRPDGKIDYVGRLDQQVKVRGFRIELGEIEAVVGEHPAVREVAVLAREDGPGERRVVAYIMAHAGASLELGELRGFLRQRVPEYMVPSAFVRLEAMPLTPSGKVDRRALPAPDQERPALEEVFVATRTPVEELLAEIWAEVLGLEQVGIYDSFFDLGGHSLLATRLISRLRDAFQVEIPLRSLFEAPTVAGLAESVNTSMRAGQAPQAPPILPVSRDGDLPLSFAQQRLWFLDQLVPGSASYNIPSAVRMRGRLDVVALEKSLQELVRRHEGLRATFPSVDGRPVQVISPDIGLILPLIDLQELSESEREMVARRVATEEAHQPFTLTQGPLLRATLLRLGAEDHVLLMTVHHITADGWSIGILVQEFATLYDAFAARRPSPLPDLPVHYADFAAWQRQWLQGDVFETQLSYWKRQWAGSPPVLALPTDRPRPAVQTFRGADQPIVLSQDLSKALRDLSRREGVTLFMTLLAALQTLLHRYSAQEDIVVGTAMANRTRAETERMVGFFMNTLALRVDFAGDPSFRELLRRVREVCLGAYAHQDLPFERLVDELQTERDLSHTPLFQVAFQLQHARQETIELPALTLSPFRFENQTAKFDLTLSMVEGRDRLVGSLEYNTDLFNDATISRLLGHLQTVLAGIVAHPEQRLSSLPLSPAAEQHQLLVAWNATARAYPQAQCIHHLFESQVARTPDAVALVFDDAHLTYQGLNQRANQLAHHLQHCGVGPEVLVGICVERSLEMIVGLLGVLKAGGAYVPLDPTYPPDRLVFMVADTHMPVLLTQQALVERLPASQAQVICLDTGWEAICTEPEGNPPSPVLPEHLAYVIYTSGSMGRPKGTLLHHRGLCNFATACVQEMGIQADSCLLQFASFSFDASVAEIFKAFVAGARLCVIPQDLVLSVPALVHRLQEQAVTMAILPPSLLAVLPAEELPVLRMVISAGESCPAEVVTRWAPGRRFFNAYGPTEATVGPTWYLVDGVAHLGTSLPIGGPIANIQLFVLDRQLQPVPIGVPGELCIGGVGLARGYLNRPDLTAEQFIPHPFSAQPGARLYKTGDLARYLPDGNLAFLGRLDQQVKLRGLRIELQEIEAVLRRHPRVDAAVVTTNPEKTQMYAYFTAKDQDSSENRHLELWPSVAEFFVYDELLYYAMTHDERRNQSYHVALTRHVKDKVVLDLGTGKDAILARLCVEAGAKKVYALEVLEEAYAQARACVHRLGLADKIRVIHGDATTVELPEQVDVCVSEIVGSIGGCEGAAMILNEARRLLKAGGVMIPTRSTTRMAAVTLPDAFVQQPAFTEVAGRYVDQIFGQVGYKFDLRVCLKGLDPSCLISTTDIFEDLDFTAEVPLVARHEVHLTITRPARLDGFVVWLNLYTVPEEVIDILAHEHCWLPVYVPVFYPGVAVAAGDMITATIERQLSANRRNPDYTITGQLRTGCGEVHEFAYEAFHARRSYRQTAFYNVLFADDTIPIRPRDRLPHDLREYLRQYVPEYMMPTAFVLLEALPLTPNGKLDRQALPAPDQARRTLQTAFVAPHTPTEKILASIWTQVLGLEHVGIHDNFFELGGDSMMSIQVIARAHQAGLRLTPTQLFQYPTIAGLAQVAGTAEAVRAEQDMVTGHVPLTPIQHWFFEHQQHDPHHWNWALLREVTQALDPSLLERTMQHLLIHHDALRLRFHQSETGWQQVNAPVNAAVPFTVVDLSVVAAEDLRATIESAAETVQASLHLVEGPLLRVAYFMCGTRQADRILIVFHHLVVDVVSARILQEDFQTIYEQLRRGEAVRLPSKTTSFQEWSRRLSAYAQSQALRQELPYWTEICKKGISPVPVDYPGGVHSEASVDSVTFALDTKETQALLEQFPAAYGAQILEVLLTALVRSFSRWTGKQTLLLELEGHGREGILEEVDLSRTVGWFTTIFPVLFDLGEAVGPRESLQAIQAQVRGIPQRGIGFGLLKYLCAESEVRQHMHALPRAEVNFNYLGQFDQALTEFILFRKAPESTGPERSLRGTRSHLLYIVALIGDGKLHLRWSYSKNLHQRATIERLARNCMEELRLLIAHHLTYKGL